MKEKQKDKESAVSRISEFVQFFGDDYSMVMPSCKSSQLVKYFDEVGRSKLEGMSEIPIGWSDLFYWMNCTNRKLSQWEMSTLLEMSGQYLYYKNNPEHVKPPFDDGRIQEQLIEVQRSFMQKQKELQQLKETNKQLN